MTVGPIVINAGPLVALSMVGQLDMLAALYGQVLVPAAVMQEVVAAGAGRPGAREVAGATFLERVVVKPPPEPLLAVELGSGEAEVIALAHRQGARLMIPWHWRKASLARMPGVAGQDASPTDADLVRLRK